MAYAVAVGATIVLGLATRMELGWPSFIAEHAGDVLYAVMFYLLLRVGGPELDGRQVAAGALAWCWTVEVLQLVDALEPIRATLPGRLILGSTFVWVDLIRYALGVVLALGADEAVRGRWAPE